MWRDQHEMGVSIVYITPLACLYCMTALVYDLWKLCKPAQAQYITIPCIHQSQPSKRTLLEDIL